jgi:hypothetical protein
MGLGELLWMIIWPILLFVLVFGAIATVVYILYLTIFQRYNGFLMRRYGYRLFNIVGGLMLLVTGLYSGAGMAPTIMPFGETLIEFFESIIFIGSPEAALSAASGFVNAWPVGMESNIREDFIEMFTYFFKVILMLMPLIIAYGAYALLKTKSPKHTLFSTLLMVVSAMIVGPLGALGFIATIAIAAGLFTAQQGLSSQQSGTYDKKVYERDYE